ncbi:MAG: hypothetical protein ABIR32_05705 [Ilumatobacteraceae bacterium]
MNAQSLHDFHESFGWVTIASNGLAGVWALAAHQFPVFRRRALWWFTGVAQFTIFVQALLGVILLNKGYKPHQFHEFYGFVAIIAVAIIYSYRNQLKGKTYLLYGVGSLFVMGLCMRAMYLRR